MNTYSFDNIIERRGTGCVKWDEATEGVIPLWVADMDFAVAPAIQEAIRKRAEHPIFGYTFIQEDYYEAVISWFKRRHHWTIAREHILYTIGVVPAMSVAIKALTLPGKGAHPVARLQLLLQQCEEQWLRGGRERVTIPRRH